MKTTRCSGVPRDQLGSAGTIAADQEVVIPRPASITPAPGYFELRPIRQSRGLRLPTGGPDARSLAFTGHRIQLSR